MFVQYFSACMGPVTNLAQGVLNIFCSIILWKTLERQTGLFFNSREATAAIIGDIVVFLFVVSIDDSYDLTSWN